MNTPQVDIFRRALYLFVVLVVLCAGGMSCTAPSTPRPTPPTGYLRSTPEPSSTLRIEFDYPETWILNHYNDSIHNEYSIRVFELTRVTPTPGCCVRLEEGVIWLDELPAEDPDAAIEKSIQAHYGLQKKVGLQGLFANENLLDVIIEESTLTVDGKDARKVISIVVEKSADGSIKRTRTEDIYVAAKGKYYRFSLVIADERRNDTFGTAFDSLVASIKFVP